MPNKLEKANTELYLALNAIDTALRSCSIKERLRLIDSARNRLAQAEDAIEEYRKES